MDQEVVVSAEVASAVAEEAALVAVVASAVEEVRHILLRFNLFSLISDS